MRTRRPPNVREATSGHWLPGGQQPPRAGVADQPATGSALLPAAGGRGGRQRHGPSWRPPHTWLQGPPLGARGRGQMLAVGAPSPCSGLQTTVASTVAAHEQGGAPRTWRPRLWAARAGHHTRGTAMVETGGLRPSEGRLNRVSFHSAASWPAGAALMNGPRVRGGGWGRGRLARHRSPSRSPVGGEARDPSGARWVRGGPASCSWDGRRFAVTEPGGDSGSRRPAGASPEA